MFPMAQICVMEGGLFFWGEVSVLVSYYNGIDLSSYVFKKSLLILFLCFKIFSEHEQCDFWYLSHPPRICSKPDPILLSMNFFLPSNLAH